MATIRIAWTGRLILTRVTTHPNRITTQTKIILIIAAVYPFISRVPLTPKNYSKYKV